MSKVLYYIVLFCLIFLCGYIALCALSSCTVTKAKQSKRIDSSFVNKTDSGAVKINTNTEKNASEWERQIVIYNRDTTINKYIATGGKTPVINMPQPQVIITERGNSHQEKQAYNYDSAWNKKLDSLQNSIQESSKEKKEEAFTLWQTIGLTALIAVVLILISKLKFSFK